MKKKRTNKNSNKDHQSKEFKKAFNSYETLLTSENLLSDVKSIHKLQTNFMKDGFKYMVNLASEGKFTEELCNKVKSFDHPELFQVADALRVISNFTNKLKELK